MNKKVILLLIFTLIFNYFLICKDDDTEKRIQARKERLEKIREKILENERKLSEAKSKELIQKKNIKEIENQLQLTQEYVKSLEEQEGDVNKNIDDIQNNIYELNQKLAKAKEELRKRLVYEYKNGNMEQLKILLGSESFTEFKEFSKYSELIDNENKKFFDKILFYIGELELKQNKLENRKEELRKIKFDKIEKKNNLELLKRKREYLLSVIQSQQNLYRSEITKLTKLTEELNNAIKTLESRREKIVSDAKKTNPKMDLNIFSKFKGTMRWPVDKPIIVNNYGNIVDETYGTTTFNGGLDIKNIGNSRKVYAVSDGVVIYRGYLRGIGNVVMLDHGNNFMTLYAHLSEISVSEGEFVKDGNVLGEIKENGILHFEIRKDKYTLDPINWLRKM